MVDKYLGDYIDEMFKLIDPLSDEDKLATAFGFMNLMLHKHPRQFMEWSEPLVTYPPEIRQHPHYDVLRELRKEVAAYE